MKLKRKSFSEISESSPGGVSYHTAQVTSEYILDPVENVIYKIEDSPINDVKAVKKNTGRVKSVIKPINDYIKYKRKKRSEKKSKSFSSIGIEKLFGRSFLGRGPRFKTNLSNVGYNQNPRTEPRSFMPGHATQRKINKSTTPIIESLPKIVSTPKVQKQITNKNLPIVVATPSKNIEDGIKRVSRKNLNKKILAGTLIALGTGGTILAATKKDKEDKD